MKKRTLIKILSYSVSVALVSAVFSMKSYSKQETYKQEIQNEYSYMMDELSTATNNISTILNKARYATTPSQMSGMAAKLLAEAEVSKNSLSQLPIGNELTMLNRFFSQVGNYALAVSKSLITDGEISEKDIENIEHLSKSAQKVANIVNGTRAESNNPEYWARLIESKIENDVSVQELEESFNQLEDELKDYPTLIYDGPHSDHLLNKEASLLKDAEPIAEEKGKMVAARWCQVYLKDLKYTGKSKGRIDTFNYSGENLDVSVTVKGGHILYFRKQPAVEEIILNHEQAVEKAKRYLQKMGMQNLKETYYYESDGVCTVNFAFLDGKTICYTDLIKVGVAMDTGDVIFYEAGGYISNHIDRTLKTPKYSEEEAKKIISPKLKVEDVRLAVIPTDSVKEKRCYEFLCTASDGQEILVYINTATLAEEEILILCKSDGGILVK